MNNRLIHSKIVETKLCDFCEEADESLTHNFYDCRFIKPIIKELEKYVSSILDSNTLLSKQLIFTGVDTQVVKNCKECVALICFVFKQKIYAAKCAKQKPNAQTIIKECNFIRKLQKKQAYQSGNVKRYNATWPDGIRNMQDENSDDIKTIVREYLETL